MNKMVGILGGIFGGISACLFISILNYAQNLREMNPKWILILPFAGLLIQFLRGAPKLIFGSFLTHLGGGSAGREGAVIHLARTLSEITGPYFKFPERKARKLILVSVGAGLGAVLGAPIAGFIFGFEYHHSSFFRIKTLFHSLIANFIAQAIVRFSKVPHFHLPLFEIPHGTLQTYAFTFLLGILFGFLTLLFHLLRRRCESAFDQTSPLLTGFIGGGFLLILYQWFGLQEYQGLGAETILHASQMILPLAMVFKKMILTALTLGTGFQGGEYFPLAFMGSTLGSSLSFVDPSLTPLFAALGFVATYGAATQTPIACTILAAELFGWNILPFAAITLWIASQIYSLSKQ